MTNTSDRFTALPDEETLAATVVALEEHGFNVEVVDGFEAARQAVLARIPMGSSVMTNASVTLAETGIWDAINDGGAYDSARNKMFALDFETQAQEMKAIGGQPDYALGSVQAVTRDGTLVIASASGSQPRASRLRAAQLRREDPRDPPGAARPHPPRSHPPASRLLTVPILAVGMVGKQAPSRWRRAPHHQLHPGLARQPAMAYGQRV